MIASFRIIVGVIALSFVALYARAQTVSSDNTHRALMIAGGARIILRDDGKVVVFENPTLRDDPVLIKGASDIVVVAGTDDGIALRADGAVLSWTAKCNPNKRPECTYSEAKS